ncbi:MAG: DUF4876 domain-containing protein [Muribaculaceae bacterium]|nr:DUF4876 domain-containing protein [Muribaculaceae bacterium]
MKYIFLLLLPLFLLSSCDDSLSSSLTHYNISMNISLPDDISPESVSEATATFRNISSGVEQKFTPGTEISVLPGLYDVEYEAKALLSNGAESRLRATLRSVSVTSSLLLTLEPFSCVETNDLIISEIFFTGTLNPSGNNYKGDDYIKLYNNGTEIIYADGLALIESKFNTTQKYDYTPDIMNEEVSVDAIYVIPGSGHDYPVKPGEYLLLADTGIDHRHLNPYSFDLSGADFEWYDVSTSPSNVDIDSPTVPNLDKWYCYTNSYFILHNRGFKAYGLARIPVEKERFLKDNLYSYNYTVVSDAGSFPMTATAYRIPNEWIVDWVNCSVKASYAWTVCAPVLDMGWTSCGIIDKGKDRFFHSVRRKLLYINENGNPVFKDTNNSSADFNPDCTASEIELAGSVMDQYGNQCLTVTYDGITPVKE